MRYLPLLAIVLVSLCTGLPEIPFFNPGNSTSVGSGTLIIDSESPDLFISLDAVPNEVKSGRSANLMFELRNKKSYPLENINLTIYDTCIFTTDDEKNYIKEIKANGTKTINIKLTAEDTELDKTCNIKFRVDYQAENSFYQDIAVLSKDEYEQREISGTLGNVPVQQNFPYSPLLISLSISDKQPFMENEKYYLTIDYRNVGSGIIYIGNITMLTPPNIKDVDCNNDYKLGASSTTSGSCFGIPFSCYAFEDPSSCEEQPGCVWNRNMGACLGTYTGPPGPPTSCEGLDQTDCNSITGCRWEIKTSYKDIFYLARTLRFIGNRAQTSTCSFTTTTTQPINIKSLALTASYKYALDNSISIRVRVK